MNLDDKRRRRDALQREIDEAERAEAVERAAARARELPGCECGHGVGVHGWNGCGVKNGHDEYCPCPVEPLSLREERRERVAEAMKCADHPRYKAKGRPTSACERCWRMWIQVNP